MVKVIENGEDTVFEIICKGCGSKLTYMYIDTYCLDEYAFDRYIRCPICGSEICADFRIS